MKLNKLALALSLTVFALPLTAMAQDAAPAAEAADQANAAPEAAVVVEEAESNLSWNLSVTSNYVFRGATQTNDNPALQGGLDYAFGDSGWYVGTWLSNIDFVSPGTPDIELDGYFGYSVDFSDDWNLDLHAVRYFYLGSSQSYGSIDYNEYFAKVTYAEMINFTVAYANDYANGGYSSMYYNLGGSFDLGHDFSLNASVGHSNFSDDFGSYDDWNIGVSRQFGPVDIAINYYDTSTDDATAGFRSDNWVLSFAFGG
jgi:uncharacterized protein (TIGR02001 family)